MKSRLQLPKCAGVYLITCTANQKIYIGSTNNLWRRWNEHRRDLRAGIHDNSHLQAAWLKYGEDSFTIAVLERCETDALNEREQYYLDTWKPFKGRGFNLGLFAGAAMRGREQTPEARAKIKAANIGRPRSPETLARMSEAQKGKKRSPESIAKQSATMTGKKRPPEAIAKTAAANRGRKFGAEFRAKISEQRKGKTIGPRSAETRAKIAAGKCKHTGIAVSPDGEELQITNLLQFCREHKLDYETMRGVANGKLAQCKGWKIRK